MRVINNLGASENISKVPEQGTLVLPQSPGFDYSSIHLDWNMLDQDLDQEAAYNIHTSIDDSFTTAVDQTDAFWPPDFISNRPMLS